MVWVLWLGLSTWIHPCAIAVSRRCLSKRPRATRLHLPLLFKGVWSKGVKEEGLNETVFLITRSPNIHDWTPVYHIRRNNLPYYLPSHSLWVIVFLLLCVFSYPRRQFIPSLRFLSIIIPQNCCSDNHDNTIENSLYYHQKNDNWASGPPLLYPYPYYWPSISVFISVISMPYWC